MSRSSFFRALLILSLLLASASAFAHDRDVDTRLARHLADDVAKGRITRDDAVALKVAALFATDLLPREYRGELPHCGTGLMLELQADLPNADPGVQQLVAYALSKPSVRRELEVPNVDALPLTHANVARQLLRRMQASANATTMLFTPHFIINYDPAVSTPAYATALGAAMEQSYTTMVTAYGFAPPVPVSTSLIDVVITDDVPCPADPSGGIFDICDISGAAIPPGFSNFSYVGPAIFVEAGHTLPVLQVLAAHEFFHLLQYENASPGAMLLNYWWCEGSATAAEDVVFPGADRYIPNQLQGGDGFFARTNYPIHMNTYESVLYHKFLMEKYAGGSAALMRDILTTLDSQIIPDVFQAIRTVLAGYGSDLDEAMKHFALWNFHSGTRTTVMHSYGDSSLFPDFSNFQGMHQLSSSVTSVPATPTHIMPSATHVFNFRPSGLSNPKKLTIKVNTVSFGHIRGWVVIRRFSGSHEIRELTSLNTSNVTSEASTTINDFGSSTIGEVALILSNGMYGGDPLLAHYEAKFAPSIDLAFCMDTTGSMGGSITAIKNTAIQAMQTLGAGGADFRIAITEFKDHPVSPYGSPGDFPYRPNSPFSNQPSVILGGLNMLVASGGNDTPESQYSGVMGAIAAQGITPWRNDANKSIIVMTDAPPHDPEPITGYTAASVIAAANAGGVSLPPSFPNFAGSSKSRQVVPSDDAVRPIRIYGIVVGSSFSALNYLTMLADGTGGKVYTATRSIDDITEALLEAVGDIGEEPEPPANQPPDVASAIADPSQLWPATNKMVPVAITNVSDPEGDTFAINITGITQDEPVNAKNQGQRQPDASGVGTAMANVRAERDGEGNGRVYRISFTATDSKGASSSGSVTVCVPHDQGGNSTCTDDGQSYTSTDP